MKAVIYKGPPCNLGRFGDVKPGDQLELSEQEWATVKGDKQFQPKDEKPKYSGEFLAPAPGPTSGFDLRRIDWTNERLANKLSLKSKNLIMDIGHAMKELGMTPRIATRFQKSEMIDSILEEARDAGWTEMSVVVVHEDPNTSNEDTETETDPTVETESTEGQTGESQVEGEGDPTGNTQTTPESTPEPAQQPSEPTPATPQPPAAKPAAQPAKKAADKKSGQPDKVERKGY